MKNKNESIDISAKVKATGELITVYKLKQGTPTAQHLFCDATPFNESSGKPFGYITFTEAELIF